MLNGRRAEAAALVIAVAFGCMLALHYAGRGFHPLDGSIVFDAGWRMLGGQVPLRDFVAPESIVPGALQALCFALFGVDWSAYALHAGVLNGAFAGLVFLLLRALAVERRLALLCALASAVVFQPPIGAPFPELHAFFFALAATLAGVAGMRAQRALPRVLALACVTPLLALGLFSYKNPSVFAIPLVLLGALLAPGPRGARRWNALGLALGAAFTALVLAALVSALAIDSQQAWLEFWVRPSRLGAKRMPESPLDFVVSWFERGLYREGLLLTRVVWAAFVLIALAGRRGLRSLQQAGPLALPACAVAFGFEAIGVAFRSTATNQAIVGMGLLFASFGLLLGTLLRMPLPAGASGLRRTALHFALVLLAFDLAYLTLWVNPKRVVNDMLFDAAKAGAPATPELAGLDYQSGGFYRTSAADLDRVIAFLRAQPENFLLIGDHSILYGLTGKPSVGPSLWFHDGLTAPKLSSRTFAQHRRRLLDRVDAYAVGWIVVEGEKTAMRSSLEHFPELLGRIRATGCAPRQYGNFRLFRIGTAGDCR